MSEFKEGLYDQLITGHLRRLLDHQTAAGLKAFVQALEENDCPDYLARHLIRQIKWRCGVSLRKIESNGKSS